MKQPRTARPTLAPVHFVELADDYVPGGPIRIKTTRIYPTPKPSKRRGWTEAAKQFAEGLKAKVAARFGDDAVGVQEMRMENIILIPSKKWKKSTLIYYDDDEIAGGAKKIYATELRRRSVIEIDLRHMPFDIEMADSAETVVVACKKRIDNLWFFQLLLDRFPLKDMGMMMGE